ncbi:NUDIX hydrolase [Leptolyngbya sp. DQ-M1]|uniref:NUDIX hydrolase n=1 Tax=Leptolyngbya sp. DQ-M1 TaxID=2933920 RepID=UPI003299BCB4
MLKLSHSDQKEFPVIHQSGVIPYRIQSGNIEVLLVTTTKRSSAKNVDRWSIPKGWIEPFMSAADSAAKEAYEEAGVRGLVKTPAIGDYQRRKLGLPCRVEVFLMQVEVVLEDWAEAKVRKRRWFSVLQAIKKVQHPQLKRLLAQLPEMLSPNAEGVSKSRELE